MRALLARVFVEVPLRFYAYADTGAAGARLLSIAIMLGALGFGAAAGAGMAWLMHRDVEAGIAAGVAVAAVVCLLYGVLIFALLIGGALAGSPSRGRHQGPSGQTESRVSGDAPVALWVVAAFFGILGVFIGVVTAVMALGELPYNGPRAEVLATIVDLRQGHNGRLFIVEYTADGERRTAEVAIDDATDLTIESRVGDETPLEYQLSDPARIRGAGQALEMRSTVNLSGQVAAGCLAITAATAAMAHLGRSRGRATSERGEGA